MCVLSEERTRHCMRSPARLPAERLRSALRRTAAAGPPLPWRPPGSKTAHLPALLPAISFCAARGAARALTGALRRAQYMHIPVRDQCNWLRERIETAEAVRIRPAPGPRMRPLSMRARSLLAPPRSRACVSAAEGPQWTRRAARGAGCG